MSKKLKDTCNNQRSRSEGFYFNIDLVVVNFSAFE
jgi:hypothetical protein